MLYNGFSLSSWPLSKNLKKNGKISKFLDLRRKLWKKSAEHTGDGDSNCSWCTWNCSQSIGKGIRTVGIQKKNRDYSDYSIVEIGKNTEKSPGDLGRLSVSQILVKDRQITLGWKLTNDNNNKLRFPLCS